MTSDHINHKPRKTGKFRWPRRAMKLCVTAVALVAALCVLGRALRPNLGTMRQEYPAQVISDVVAAREAAFSPEDAYSLHRDIDVLPKGESPILSRLVETGELPPLNQRLPEKPIVMEGVNGIGNYGGTWLRIATSVNDAAIIDYRLSGAYLVRWSPLGYPIEPHIAQSVDHSNDYKTWTVTLREGLKWSDGFPFTADDILYWWNDEATHPMFGGSDPSMAFRQLRLMRVEDSYGHIKKIDDYHVQFIFDKPYPLFLEALTQMKEVCDTPAHYLRQYHPDPKIGDAEKIKQTIDAFRLPSPIALYRHLKSFQNPEHPRLWPWVYRTYRSGSPQTFVRNPYYYVVDTAGNQLPYLDRIQFEVKDTAMMALSAAGGYVSMQARQLQFQDYTEFMSRRQVAGTRVLHWYNTTRATYAINPNMNRRVDPADPVTQWKADLLKDKRFRQALSLAINRNAIIRSEYSGVGEPSQVAPGRESPFHHERLLKAFTEYDPRRANELLDGIGLTHRDGEGYRTFPSGSRMTWFLDYTSEMGVGPAQFVVDDWAAVGIRVIPRQRSRSLYFVERDARTFDFSVGGPTSDVMPLISGRYYIAEEAESRYAPAWGAWFERGGFFGMPGAEVGGGVPVPTDHPMYEAMTEWLAARRESTFEKQKAHLDRVLDIGADNLWSINISTPPPAPVIVKQNFHNVPRLALYGYVYSTPANAGIETYYMDESNNSAGAIAEIQDSIVHPTPMPGARTDAIGRDRIGGWVRTLVWLVVAGFVVMMALRHPFIGRRILILIPTLVIISVVVFTIIQAPPGDFLSTRIIQLQESGDDADMKQIEDLRAMFHFDEPMWQRYLRWIGVWWFWTYDNSDTGILQGNLGRSMEANVQPVSELVGERVMLTVAISAGTILFTWIVAIPIGIYSAVKQYSAADYVLTLIGFVGMCVPSFLFALVLTAVSGSSGLFSPEYAAQPEWTIGKLLDLGAHIWIPIVVLGVHGTASMIRVMRGNLLDELNKPYVVTARAKGVRPLRLLFKYPVRLAMNPFISSIGHLFPQMISGGAIVAMVLALPTVGPLLLSALFTQDMYLAGSLLMILSLLGVLGTLVSDLLLLWLDPRIRFEGGGR